MRPSCTGPRSLARVYSNPTVRGTGMESPRPSGILRDGRGRWRSASGAWRWRPLPPSPRTSSRSWRTTWDTCTSDHTVKPRLRHSTSTLWPPKGHPSRRPVPDRRSACRDGASCVSGLHGVDRSIWGNLPTLASAAPIQPWPRCSRVEATPWGHLRQVAPRPGRQSGASAAAGLRQLPGRSVNSGFSDRRSNLAEHSHHDPDV